MKPLIIQDGDNIHEKVDVLEEVISEDDEEDEDDAKYAEGDKQVQQEVEAEDMDCDVNNVSKSNGIKRKTLT